MNKSNWRDIMQREGSRTELERGKYIDESYPKTKPPTQINYKIVSLIAACAVLVIALNILLPTLFNGSHGITPGGDITTNDGYTKQYPDHGTLEPEDENVIVLKDGTEIQIPHALCWMVIHGGTDENGLEQIMHGDGLGYMFFFSDNPEYDIPIIPIDDIVAVPDVSYQIIDGTTTESDYPQAIKTNVTFGELKKYVGSCDDDVIYVYFTDNYTSNDGKERGANDYVFAVSKDGTSAY